MPRQLFFLDHIGEAIGFGKNWVVATGLGTGRKVRFPVALRTSREALSKKLPEAQARLQMQIGHAKATIFL